jgi:putative transcriptional regulator
VIRSRLSSLMGEKRVRVADVARETGISRNMLARLYYDRVRRLDLNDLDKLCRYFDCRVEDVLLWEPGQANSTARKRAK